jgi:beta-galactosidase
VAVIGTAGMRLPIWAQKAAAAGVASQLLLGVDYYPDQTPEGLWEEDSRMMVEAGFTNVRIAEFAWALMEPSEGKFDFVWLRRAVQTLHKHNLSVILGTPSAAPPPWLSLKYPEIMEVNAEGQRLHAGGRRFTCPTNKVYRRLSLAIASEMAKAFAETRGVIGWQIDNEFTLSSSPRCYCSFCQTGFQEWLRSKYGSLDKLNQTWGTVFWSQTYTDFAQIPVPLPSGGDPNPGLALDYDRYQSYANTSFLEEQLVMLRQKCPRHFVTTNNVGPPVDYIDLRELYKNLDFASFDNYPGFFEMLLHQQMKGGSVPAGTIRTATGLQHDFARSVKGGKPYMIMEQQSGKAGQRTFSPQPEKGQVRLWTYQAIAHGAMGVNYFRWDTATFGAEEYWHGVLNHDRSKSPAYDEIKQTVKELKALGLELLYSRYPAEVALVFDYDCGWALQIQSGHHGLSYVPQVTAWYGAITASHTGIDVVPPGADLTPYKIVFAPLAYVLSEAQAARIRNFVQAGGVFVTSFRLGVKTESSQMVRTPLPGLLRDVMGVTVEDYIPIYSAKQGVKFSAALAGPDGECGLWADILQPSGAEVVGSYTAGEHAGAAAVTINGHGKGKAVYVGADLDPASLARVLRTLAASAGVQQPMDVPAGVEMTVRKSDDKQWIFLLNHSSVAQTVSLPKTFTDLLTKEAHSGTIELSGYGVRVLA